MINYKDKYIFVRVPRTASRAISSILDCPFLTHTPIEKLKTKKTKNFFSFVFVRNPWDRLVSSFFYLKKGGLQTKGDLKRKKIFIDSCNGDFSIFVHKFFKNNDEKNLVAQSPINPVHFRHQGHWLNINGVLAVDYVGRFENINKDWEYISTIIKNKNELKKTNSSEHCFYKKHYDKETKEIVGKFYANDVLQFGYVF